MFEFNTLQYTSPQEILSVFNHAFSDYVVPFILNYKQLEDKIQNEGIDLSLSIGVFVENRLVAFILHAYNPETQITYNAGTGVIPAFRGHQLTHKMYNFILPALRKKGVKCIILEVIASNEKAIKIYERIGFKEIRKLNCYKGKIATPGTTEHYKIVLQEESFDFTLAKTLWDIEPSWQNDFFCAFRSANQTKILAAYSNSKLVGYLIFNFESRKILQCAVHKTHRNRGVAKSLFSYLSDIYGTDYIVTNIDCDSNNSNNYLKQQGLQFYLQQNEMVLRL